MAVCGHSIKRATFASRKICIPYPRTLLASRQTHQNAALLNQMPEIDSVHLSESERLGFQLKPQNLQKGLLRFHQNGFVILENAISHAAVDHLRLRMLQDIPTDLTSPEIHYNHGKAHRNISQALPFHTRYLHEEIWANRCVVALLEHIIGPRPRLSYATSNIALPGGEGRQWVHSDYYCNYLDFPVFLEVYAFLDDVGVENGSTEIWPGTHAGYKKRDHTFPDRGWIKHELVKERFRVYSPIQPSIPKGSICLRDLRLWHAGMQNRTDVPRIMVGFIYSPRWFRSQMRLRFPKEARMHIESWKHVDCLDIADFVDNDMNYLDFRQDLNLTQEESIAKSGHEGERKSLTAAPVDYWLTDDE